MLQKYPIWILLLPMAISSFGCSSAEDHQLAELRDKLLLTEEPDAGKSIVATKDQLSESPKVVVIGRVTESELGEIARYKAQFLLSDIPSSDHEEIPGHEAEDCPFCQREAEQALKAAVRFVDEQGEILPYDVAELFLIHPGDVVVVQGQAELFPNLNLISITADRLYIRR